MKKHLLALFLLSLAIFLAYANSINGTWALDDVLAYRPVAINQLHDLLGFRKVAYVTFLFNQRLAEFSAASFRLFNIGLHIFNVCLVYLLAWKTTMLVLGKPDKTDRIFPASDTKAFNAAFISGAVFGLHPLNINAVAYIVQRMASLASLFVLLALLSYILASQTAHRLKKFSMYVLSAVFIVAGIFSKENAVMAGPLILLYDYAFLSGQDNKVFLKKLAGLAGIFILLIAPVSYFLKFHSTFIDIAQTLLKFNQPIKASAWTAVDVYWTPFQHLLTEFRIITRYLLLVIAPLPQFLVFDWWGVPVSKGFMEPATTLFSVVALSALLAFSIWKIKRFPLLCFGLLWYFTAISLESFIAVGSDLYFEHRNYLPLTGFFIGSIGQVMIMINRESVVKRLWIAAVLIGLTLGSLTFTRNHVWKDSVALWGDTVSKTHGNLRAIISLSNSYVLAGDIEQGQRYYRELLKNDMGKGVEYIREGAFQLGLGYLFVNKFNEAADIMERFGSIMQPHKRKILAGFFKAQEGNLDAALETYREVLDISLKTMSESDAVVLFNLVAEAYRGKEMFDKAIEYYHKALSYNPDSVAAYYGLGASYLAKRNILLAKEYMEKTLSLNPGNVLALSDMADITLITKGSVDKALEYAERAVTLEPPFYQPYLAMGNVLFYMGKEDHAERFYGKVRNFGIKEYVIPLNKARIAYMKGDRASVDIYIREMSAIKGLPENLKRLRPGGIERH